MTETAAPDVEERIRRSFDRQGLLLGFGATVELIDSGRVVLAMPRTEAVTQQHGYFHAAAIAALADSAGGYAAMTLYPPGFEVLAVEYKISLFAPADGPRLVADARVLRSGRLSTCLIDVEVEDPQGNLTACATVLQTVTRIPVGPEYETSASQSETER
jgi:uncharacterized protein (TIGR00369 family)